MNILEGKLTLLALFNEIDHANKLIKQDHTNDFNLRSYVRSTFACAEGVIWVLKQLCLHNGLKADPYEPTPAETICLSEISIELKENGKIDEKTKFLKFTNNFRFTFQYFSKHFKVEEVMDPSMDGWAKFKAAYAIRNRITHPKSIKDFKVSEADLITCLDANTWFMSTFGKTLEHLLNKSLVTTSCKRSA